MGDDPLQFVALEPPHAAIGHANHRVVDGVTGCEGIDPLFAVHHVHLRHWHARGDGHLLDDIHQLLLVGVGAGHVHQPPAHHRGDAGSATQLTFTVQPGQTDHHERPEHDPQGKHRIQKRGEIKVALVPIAAGQRNGHGDDQEVQQRNKQHRDAKQKNQNPGFFLGLPLALEEVH